MSDSDTQAKKRRRPRQTVATIRANRANCLNMIQTIAGHVATELTVEQADHKIHDLCESWKEFKQLNTTLLELIEPDDAEKEQTYFANAYKIYDEGETKIMARKSSAMAKLAKR